MRIQKRTLFIGIIVWLLVFWWWFRFFLFRNWHFQLFSLKSWRFLINEFHSGWQISSKSDWIFIFSFVFAPFIFGFLWYWAQKIRWRKSTKKVWLGIRWPLFIFKKKRLKKVMSVYAPKQSAEPTRYRPQLMPSSGARPMQASVMAQPAFLNNSTAMSDFQSFNSQPPVQENIPATASMEAPSSPVPESFTNEAFAEMANTPISDIQIPKPESVQEDVKALLENAGYTLLTPIQIAEEKMDFVGVSASELLICLYDKKAGDWLADEESFNEEDPLWFSETDHRVSPVFQLKQAVPQLQQKIGDILTIHPVLIEQAGTIINAEDMMKTWNDLGVSVCRTGAGGPVELPTCTEQFKEVKEKISPDMLEKIKALL